MRLFAVSMLMLFVFGCGQMSYLDAVNKMDEQINTVSTSKSAITQALPGIII